MTYKLNTLGREIVHRFIRTNANFINGYEEYYEEAESRARLSSIDIKDGVIVAWLKPHQTIQMYEVLLILRQEHYYNVGDDVKTTHKTP